ncbi:MAG TPA: carboxymuconolactone decarboxylase family protein [Methylomirabilota bacterium]|nr:carboxymuconolactone decarboxylase family protein [Methylomirabilota bacterium]
MLMARLQPLDLEATTGRTRELLVWVRTELGMLPNVIRTIAHSPAVLEGYLGLNRALATGRLPAALREQIALTVAAVNRCAYCLAAHSALARMAGLSEEAIRDSRQGASPDRTVEAALDFACRVADQRGQVHDRDVARLRRAGYVDSDIAELVGQVALSIFTNYFAEVAGTAVDFPMVPDLGPLRRDPGARRGRP